MRPAGVLRIGCRHHGFFRWALPGVVLFHPEALRSQSVAYLLLPLILLPYLKNRYGNGSMSSVRKPKSEDAH